MVPPPPLVRVTVITYRRPVLLERALRSLLAQTHANWVAEVLNDDPADLRVPAVVAALGDPRIQLAEPPRRRGGTGNFNHAFRPVPEPYGAVLEDDNWWEPAFLATMLDALARHPGLALAIGNERRWLEGPDGSWHDTGTTIWPEQTGEALFGWDPLDKCGGAKLCNSALVFRTAGAERWQTPATIPIDVTEHFRERTIPHPLLLVHAPLVNFAVTRATHRSGDRGVWAAYQQLLIASVAALTPAPARAGLAARLWERARGPDPRLATSLLSTGLFVPEARALWRQGRIPEKLRFWLGVLRRPRVFWALRSARRRLQPEWEFLLTGAFAHFMTGSDHAAPPRA